MDAYCERIGPGLFAEPLNALTNVSFLIAAWAAWVLAKRTGTLSPSVGVLIALGASVGIGSILWHTLANTWTLILDIVPILIFLIWFIWLYTRTVIGLRALFAGLSVGAFLLAATFLAFPYAGVLHGALLYTPGLIVALVLGIFQARALPVARFALLGAAGTYFAALSFRTIDQEVCSVLPIGTHFIWHSLIGLVTYLAMRAFTWTVLRAKDVEHEP